MTKQSFLAYCLSTYGTVPDYPFDKDFETAVMRHVDNRKWYAIVMREYTHACHRLASGRCSARGI